MQMAFRFRHNLCSRFPIPIRFWYGNPCTKQKRDSAPPHWSRWRKLSLMENHTVVSLERDYSRCTDPGSSRFVLGAGLLVPDQEQSAWLVTTDGRCATYSRLSGVETTPQKKLVPGETLKAGKLQGNGRWELGPFPGRKGKTAIADPVYGRFPRVNDLAPESIEGRLAICLDARLLAKMQETLNSKESQAITLFIKDGKEAVTVLGDDGFGLLMPCAPHKPDEAEERYCLMREQFFAAYALAPPEESTAPVPPEPGAEEE
jgi:hypothetical protein